MDTHSKKRAIPESFRIGEQFEDYVRHNIFIKEHYTLVERTHGYEVNSKDFIESSRNPDFKFRDHLTKTEFYVEVKFRSNTHDDMIEWCRYDQLLRYQDFHKSFPVFIIIGLGGSPDAPDILSLLPITEAKYTSLYLSRLTRFLIPINQPIQSNKILSLLAQAPS